MRAHNSIQHTHYLNLLLCALFLVSLQLGADGSSPATAASTNERAQASEQQQPAASQIERTPQESQARQAPATGSSDIVISSLDDGLLTPGKGSSERHLYEQQSATVTALPSSVVLAAGALEPSQQEQQAAVTPAESQVAVTSQVSKPEPRNQNEEQQPLDPVIIDHRPSGEQQIGHQQDFSNNQQVAQQASSNNSSRNPQAAPVQTASGHPATPAPASAWYQQAPAAAPVPAPQLFHYTTTATPPQQRTNGAMQAGGQQAAGYGSMASSASNQVYTIQHPTSINSIINEQQQQQQSPIANQQTPQQQVGQATQMQPTSMAASSTISPQSQVVSVNGQPVILVPNGLAPGGRRISITGWLRGLSSMLANIFNRRDHPNQLMLGQASNTGLGHWVQFGSNAPHWLSQAQTAIQQGQQQYQQQFSAQPLGSASTNRYVAYVPVQPSGQQQPVGQLGGNAGYSGDMQASASSTSYIAIQAPPQQPYQPQQVAVTQQQQQQPANAAPANRQYQPGNTLQQQQQPASQSPSALNQSWSVQGNGQQQQQQQPTRQSATDVNLPLAHYSRFEASSTSD